MPQGCSFTRLPEKSYKNHPFEKSFLNLENSSKAPPNDLGPQRVGGWVSAVKCPTSKALFYTLKEKTWGVYEERPFYQGGFLLKEIGPPKKIKLALIKTNGWYIHALYKQIRGNEIDTKIKIRWLHNDRLQDQAWDKSWNQIVTQNKSNLIGGFNPFEQYWSKWKSSPNKGENKKNIWTPPPRNYSEMTRPTFLVMALGWATCFSTWDWVSKDAWKLRSLHPGGT